MLSGELKGYRELTVWKRSMELVTETYKLSKYLPKEEKYGLCDQIRRSSVSIPSNIAEGNGRGSKKDYLRFLYMARDSQCELETQLLICVQLGYLRDIDLSNVSVLCDETGKMLNALITKFEKDIRTE